MSLFPSELTEHRLWWNGPEWLQIPSDQWPSQIVVTHAEMPTNEERDVCLHTMVSPAIIPLQQISSFTHLKRVTTWVLHFINNCRQPKTNCPSSLYLSSAELTAAESYWISLTHCQAFSLEIESLRKGEPIPNPVTYSHYTPLSMRLDYSALVAGVGIPRCCFPPSTQSSFQGDTPSHHF